jgi:hypothetical protein
VGVFLSGLLHEGEVRASAPNVKSVADFIVALLVMLFGGLGYHL